MTIQERWEQFCHQETGQGPASGYPTVIGGGVLDRFYFKQLDELWRFIATIGHQIDGLEQKVKVSGEAAELTRVMGEVDAAAGRKVPPNHKRDARTTEESWRIYYNQHNPGTAANVRPGGDIMKFVFERIDELRDALELQAPNGRHVFASKARADDIERQLEQKQKELIAFGEANRRLSSDVDAKARTITGLGEINSELGKQVLAEKGRVDAAEQNVLVLRKQLDEMCTNADRQRAENGKLAHELRAARTESEERGRRLREARGQLAILKGRLDDLITAVMNEISSSSSPSKGK